MPTTSPCRFQTQAPRPPSLTAPIHAVRGPQPSGSRPGTGPLARLCSVLLFAASLTAEEGGTGHYTPGSFASYVDGTLRRPGMTVRLNGIFYEGSSVRPLSIDGLRAVNTEVESYTAGLTLAWRPSIAWPTNFSYAVSASLPYIWREVSVDVTGGPVPIHLESRVDGIGDLLFMPVMTSYALARDLHLDFRGVIYAPTGGYEVGRPANPGKNYWTFTPVLGLLYFGRENGLEVSAFAGTDFNTGNPDTDYHSGTQFHLDGTVAWHHRIAGGRCGVGITGVWYDQLTGDTGSGATQGSHEASMEGVGPVLSYARRFGKRDFAVELKWLHELDAENRMQGDYLWLKLLLRF